MLTLRRQPPPIRALLHLSMLITLILGLTACTGGKGDKGEGGKGKKGKGAKSAEGEGADAEAAASAAVPVEVATVTRGEIADTVYATANVRSQLQVTVLSEAAGRIVMLEVDAGDPVEEGQVVGRIDNPELSLSVEASKAQVKRVKAELARLEPLVEKGYIPRADYDRTKTELDIAEQELKRARQLASGSRLRAPIDGVVAVRHVEVGAQILPNQPVYTLLDPKALEVVVKLPERELGRLALEQRAWVISEALSKHRFPAHVSAIAPTVDPASGTVDVTVALDAIETDEGRALRPGMFVSVYIEIERRDDAALAPKRALVFEEGTAHLFVVEEGTATLETVKTGASEGDKIELIEGPSAGAEVIVLGQSNLKTGASVRVVRRDGEPVRPKDTSP